jgi:hypothetical protein
VSTWMQVCRRSRSNESVDDDHTPRAASGTIQGNKRPASSTDGADRGPACSVSTAVAFRSSFGRVVHYEWSDGALSVRGVARDAALMSVGHPGNHVGTHDRHVACDAVELELRRNRIRAGCIDEFLDAWLRGVVPLRRRFGFTVLGAWVARRPMSSSGFSVTTGLMASPMPIAGTTRLPNGLRSIPIQHSGSCRPNACGYDKCSNPIEVS